MIRASLGASLLVLLPVACSSSEPSSATGPSPDGGATGADASGDASPSIAAAAFKSGSRLKILVRRAGDAFQVTGLKDTQRDEVCNVRKAADGEMRCLPTNTTQEIVFTDASCKSPVARTQYIPPKCNLGALAPSIVSTVALRADPGSDVCGTRATTVFAVGSPIATPASVFFLSEAGVCTAVAPGSGTFSALGAEIPPASFVKVTTADEARGPELTARFAVSEDGLRQLQSARDAKKDLECRPGLTASGTRCLPTDRADVLPNIFADATCTTNAAVTFACTAKYVAARKLRDTCDLQGETSLFTVGAVVASPFSGGGGSACTAYTSPTPVVGIGAPVSEQEFPSVDRVLAGTGPVRTVEWQSGGQTVARDESFVTAEGELCFPQLLGGSARCAPPTRLFLDDTGRAGDAFADAACTVRLATAEACETLAFITVASGVECGGTRVFARGAKHTGPIYTLDAGKACVGAAAEATKAYYGLGAELPTSTFAEVTSGEL